jgi:hypothetical protein
MPRRRRAVWERHIRDEPEAERAEPRQILAARGLEGRVPEEAAEAIARDRNHRIDLKLVDDCRLSPVDPRPMRTSLMTLGAFLQQA